VLGGVALYTSDGVELDVAPQRVHIVAAIAAAAGMVVPRSELLDDLWGEDTAASRHRLKQQIAQLRPHLGTDLSIQFHLNGYRLRGSLERLDSTLFESLVTSARELGAEDRSERLRRALRLWRESSAFLGVDSLLVDDARHRLAMLRAATILDLADCELELQRPAHAIELLEDLMEQDPTRADVVTRLVSLLALSHREVDGIRVVSRYRASMVELGYTLAVEVEELETLLLRREFVAPDVRQSPRPATPLHSSTGLITRGELEARVAAALEETPVIVCGEAGVGKTVLTAAILRKLEDEGRTVTRVVTRPDPMRPMEVIVDIIEQIRVCCPDLMDELLDRPALEAAVARLAGEPAAITREMLISELTLLIRTILTTTGGALIVEDAHWLDNSSAEIIGTLMSERLAGVLVTTRRALDDLFGDAWRSGVLIEMPPFTVAEVRTLIELSLPARATEELADQLHRASGGNGVFLRLELDLLADGQLGQNVSPTLLHAVSERTRRLSEATRSVLQTAALLGPAFPLPVLAEVHPHLREALRDAEVERLVRLNPETAIGEFVHGLVVDALVDLLPVSTRIARHDQLCRALIALEESPTAVAIQAVGGEALDPIRAVVSCLGAAEQQAVVFEWASTIVWAQQGLDVAARCGFEDRRVEAELRTLLGTGLRRLSRMGSDHELGRAAELAFETGRHELLVRAVTELCLHGPTTKVGTVDAVARDHLNRALAVPVDPLQRIELLSAAATLMALSDEASLGRALYHEALVLAESAGNPDVLRAVRMNAHLGLQHPEDLAARRRAAEGLIALEDHDARWEGHFLRFGLALIDADRAILDDSINVLRNLTLFVKQRSQQRALRQTESVYAFITGDLDLAKRLADETLQLCLESYPASWSMGIYAALLMPIREAQGRVGDLLAEVAALIESAPDYVTWHVIATQVAYARRDQTMMGTELDYLARLDFGFAEDLTWTAAATIVCRPICALNDVTSAEVLYDRLLPYRGMMTWNGLSTHGPVDAGLACLAAVLGNTAAVAEHIAEARRLVDRLGAPHLRWPELDALAERVRSDGLAEDGDLLPHVG
jgi:DNA-binding SARP family transcriptional activator